MSQDILKCVCRPRIVSNASQTKWQMLPTPKCPRIIQLLFLSKYWRLIALDTVLRRKRDWVPRDWFLSPNLPETYFKVQRHHSIFQSTSFNRVLCGMPSTTNIFPKPHKISIKHFHSETAQNPTGLALKPEFHQIPSSTKTDSKNFQVLFFQPGTSWDGLWSQCFHTPTQNVVSLQNRLGTGRSTSFRPKHPWRPCNAFLTHELL